jgi:6-pyruvoyltetrahydropterin/6-carboxytetrahydropterin synthase
MTTTATRYHDFSAGHRVYGHESKCSHLHGHNYRVHFTVTSKTGLDQVGRVLDFSVIKDLLCEWLEHNWDHKFLVWAEDPFADSLVDLDPPGTVVTSFNPTAENMGQYLVEVVCPALLQSTDAIITKVDIEETRKCSVTVQASEQS